MTSCSLSDLPLRTLGRISRFDLPEDESIRVRTLGVCSGMPIEVVQNGDPLILSTCGTRIAIARRLASFVFVDHDENPASIAP